MKKYLLLTLLLLLCIPSIFAQNQDRAKMMEDLQNFKIDFLAQEMQLSEKEKAEFAPVYKEYEQERREAGAEARKFERQLKKQKNASEADYKRLSELQQSAREKDNAVVKKFDGKFESFLSSKQIYNMHQGETKFMEKMKELRKKHDDGHRSSGKAPKNKRPDPQLQDSSTPIPNEL